MKSPRRIIPIVFVALLAVGTGAAPLLAGDRDRDDRRRYNSHWRDNRHDHGRHFHLDHGRHHHPDRYRFRNSGTSLSLSLGSHYHYPRYGSSVVIHSQRYYGPRYGTIVTRLPIGCQRVYVGQRVYYYFNDVYYAPAPSGYIVINPTSIVQDTGPTAAETREAVRQAVSSASLNVRQVEQTVIESPSDRSEPVAPLEYLPSGYRTHYVNGAPVYEVNGQFYRWSPERDAYIATPGPIIE